MLSYITLTAFGLAIAYVLHTYRCYQANLAAAKQSGIPFFSTPIYTFNRAWLITHRLWLPFLKALPESLTNPWLDYMVPDFVWTKLHDTFKTLDSDAFLIVSPGANTLYVADAEAVSQITARRNDFPKPTWIYASVDIFGKNVVSTEGQVWRHHRKITSPPFTEKNNHLVWTESLHQAQSMLAGWIGEDGKGSGAVWDVAAQAMRLSLHVISRAGFGVRLQWPHEETQTQIPEGHTLSYKDALSTLLENIIVVMLTPRWVLAHSPLRIHQDANEAYVEWGKYMREMYRDKRTEVKQGESREGMDLMGALVKGAGITTEALNDPFADPEKAGASPTNKQLLTDDEILGNAFVFILAGHETAANTIHFSLLFLALHPSSQRRLQKDLDQILG
ncbi:cytochrome P450, partial [Hortaea werneckii]